jgi:hypothetical protein
MSTAAALGAPAPVPPEECLAFGPLSLRTGRAALAVLPILIFLERGAQAPGAKTHVEMA